ncbi:nSTAND3 domain-containing NTPase [Amycolatopsis sp. NPDC004747]
MDGFDLGRLTDFDFEELCKDLFEVVLGCPLEIFARGRDGGIDLRYIAPAAADKTVIQCKHWAKSGRDALVRHLRNVELPKVERLAPDRYLIATTVDLTVGAKDEIAGIFPGFVQTPGDIFGAHEIVALLRKHPEIVRRHVRLWLAGSAVLGSLLNRDVLLRSRALALDIDESLRLFAPHPGLAQARRLLDQQHSCLIAGPPGAGKTTLAHVLLAEHQAAGFTIVEATNRLDDVHRMWDDEEKQIFFVDDFVGQTTLDEGAARRANQELPRLLRMVKSSPAKRLVLTCRNYLAKQAREHHERLDARGLDPYECTVDAAALPPDIRAEIFYNHVYFSGLGPEQRAQLAEPAVYRAIIHHRNYSPRLLEHAIAEVVELPPGESGNVAQAVLQNFENPGHLWERLIEEVLDADGLALVLTLYTANRSADHDRLREAWRAHLGLDATSDADRRFRRTLRRLEPVIAKVSEDSNGRRVGFSNPSVVDFLHGHLAAHPDLLVALCDSAVFLDQLLTVWAAATQWSRPALRAAVIDRGEHFRDAVVRIQEPDPVLGEYRTDHEAAEVEFVVALAKFGASAGLVDLGDALLTELGESSWPSATALDQMTVNVAESSVPAWRKHAGKLAEWTFSATLAETHDWKDLSRLQAVMDDLAQLSPEFAKAAAEEFAARKLELAVDELAWWAEHDRSIQIDDGDLEEILDFLETEDHGLDDEYERAREYLESEPEIRDGSPEQPPLVPVEQPHRTDSMFSTFREK